MHVLGPSQHEWLQHGVQACQGFLVLVLEGFGNHTIPPADVSPWVLNRAKREGSISMSYGALYYGVLIVGYLCQEVEESEHVVQFVLNGCSSDTPPPLRIQLESRLCKNSCKPSKTVRVEQPVSSSCHLCRVSGSVADAVCFVQHHAEPPHIQ